MITTLRAYIEKLEKLTQDGKNDDLALIVQGDGEDQSVIDYYAIGLADAFTMVRRWLEYEIGQQNDGGGCIRSVYDGDIFEDLAKLRKETIDEHNSRYQGKK